jgi:hypothetical protein
MLAPSDFICIPYTADMTRAGIVYACRSLPYTYDRMGGSPFKRLRRIVAGKAVELAFKRHLNNEEIPHDMLGATPFTDPDQYDIAIGGRRCDIKSYMVSFKDRIRQIRNQPECLLEAQALVPCDQITSDHLDDEDIYIFAFLTALLTPNQESLKQALGMGQPTWMIHPLPKTWSRPAHWASLGQLALKCDTSQPLKIELGGQNGKKDFLSEQVILKPRQRTPTRGEFYALSYLYTPEPPDGIVGVYCPFLEETHLAGPLEWGNIWVYGMEIMLTGYMTRVEFRKRARRLPAGRRVFQYANTRTENLALPIGELLPLDQLFRQAKQWAKR